MKQTADKNPADYIRPLNMNGLSGRMLHLPAPASSGAKAKQREILFIYGQHSSLERWWGVIQELNQYGVITVPDLAGFGGMESLFKIGKQPTIDELADYLASFVKWRFKRKRLVIVGLSLGFPVATRMLQRYPDLVRKVDLLVSVVGFAHHDDFAFSKRRQAFYQYGSALFQPRPLAWFLQNVCFHPAIMRRVYHHSLNARQKFAGKTNEDFEKVMTMELSLWKNNDTRTWLKTNREMFRLDNCRVAVNLPVWHVSVVNDRYFDERLVEQHFRVIFSQYHHARSTSDDHGPSVIATPEQAAKMFPVQVRRALEKC
ncbi:MAG: alpha/beta fold hydrolase [Candidatus Saccharimonadales bacterium]